MAIEQIPHVLACGVGNATVRFAHVCGGQVGEAQAFRVGRLDGLSDALAALWRRIPAPRKLVAASVNPAVLERLEAAAEPLKEPLLVVGRDLPLPIQTDLPAPESVGVDRLCAAIAAFDRLGSACVVADFGTAVTVDCVNDEGVFLGGAILPGLEMGGEALEAKTAQLPRVDVRGADGGGPDWVFGKDTRQAIVGGLVFGARGALRELVESYATELGRWPIVILTGGDAKLICPRAGESGLVQAVVPDLVLRGVAIAYYRTLLP
jgi:type III pantothenate kinase